MSRPDSPRIGYVVKRYPRYSETFIVNEILAHEAADWEIEVFALRPPVDSHFQDSISRVRAPVTYLTVKSMKAAALWKSLQESAAEFPGFWPSLERVEGEDVTDVLQALQLARHVRRKRIDHLHAHFATSAAAVARLASHFAGVPYTLTAHAKDIYHDSVRPSDLRRRLHDAYAAVTVSDFNVCHLKETWPSLSPRVHRIYNGMHLEQLNYSPPAERPRQIIAVGRLIAKKGFSDLLDACHLLRQRQVDFRCVIIGAGELEQALQEQIDRLSLAPDVELMGPRPQREVIRAIQDASVMAAPCVISEDGNRDGLPTVLLEAMALGTPCVATDVTGIPEVVQHERTGLLIQQNDPAGLATALERLLEDSALRQRLAGNARQLIEEEFDVHRNTAQLRELFGRAVSSRDHASSPDHAPVLQVAVATEQEVT